VFALNLLKVNDVPGVTNLDTVNMISLSVDTSTYNGAITGALTPDASSAIKSDLYINFFNRERFWKPDPEYLLGVAINKASVSSAINAPFFQLANLSTKKYSFIVRKAVGLQQYSIFALDWYGSISNIPYQWIRPYDLMQDFFVQIIAVEGEWTNYKILSSDPYWSQFFDIDGIKVDQMNNFINSPTVNLVGSWTGCVIPDFHDQTGASQYIEDMVNGSVALTGVFCNINQQALDQLVYDDIQKQWELGDGSSINAALYQLDLVGHNLSDYGDSSSASIQKRFLSYDISILQSDFHTDVSISSLDATGKIFRVDSSGSQSLITIGSLVKSGADIQPGVTYVTAKQTILDASVLYYQITTAEPIANYLSNPSNIIVQKPIDVSTVTSTYKFIPLKGLTLTNKHLPGFNESGQASAEDGLEKIYGMLMDPGILRGLTNPDMIQYRYIVDSMAYGLRANLGGKSNLSSLAKQRGKTTAIISAPSISQFSNSQDPYFCDTFIPGVDPVPIFNTKWIASGGNPDMPRSFRCTLPSEDLGSRYCGVFGPFLKYNDNGKLVSIPPAADVSNSYVRKFLGGNPYAIVANKNGILSNPNLSGVEYNLDKTDRDYLEPFGYNSIIERPTTGQVMIYANATSFQSIKSDYNYLHVREFLNTIELQIDDILQNYVFDLNNPLTRLNIINSVTPILESAKDAGAIYKYDLVMDETNNTPDIIADGIGVLDVGVWITGALQKIVTRISVNNPASSGTGGSAQV
jgi:hypothetical protein